jgi:hypothetical protein
VRYRSHHKLDLLLRVHHLVLSGPGHITKRSKPLPKLTLLPRKHPVESRQIDRLVSLNSHEHLRRHKNNHKGPSGCMKSEGTYKHPLWFKDGSLDLDGHFHIVNSSSNNYNKRLFRLYLRFHPRDLSGRMDIRDNRMHLSVGVKQSPMG